MHQSNLNTGKWALSAALALAICLVAAFAINIVLPLGTASERAETLLDLMLPAPAPSPAAAGRQGTSTPQIVALRASATDLKVGDLVTLTATLNAGPVGGWGQPYYIVKFLDAGLSGETVEALPDLQVDGDGYRFRIAVSKILKHGSIQYKDSEVIAVFQAAAPGSTRVSIGVNGEIGETDGRGNWWFRWAYFQSEELGIRVTQ